MQQRRDLITLDIMLPSMDGWGFRNRIKQMPSISDQEPAQLHICKELVTRQGGQICVTSALNKGRTFSFTLRWICVPNGAAGK